MIISDWNIRGLNNPFKQKELKDIFLKYKVDIMGCLETKIQANNDDRIKKVFEKEWTIFTNYPTTLNGRLQLLWKGKKVKVTVIYTTTQLIHFKVKDTKSTFHSNI